MVWKSVIPTPTRTEGNPFTQKKFASLPPPQGAVFTANPASLQAMRNKFISGAVSSIRNASYSFTFSISSVPEGNVPAAFSKAATISPTSFSNFPSSRLRASASTTQSSGIIFVARPPVIVPILQVVSSSIRPDGHEAMAFAAMAMAFNPFSGSMPAWAAFP